MASIGGGGEAGSREELKSQFSTREGTYRLASAVEFSRTARPVTYVTNNTTPAPGTSPPVRISFITLMGACGTSNANATAASSSGVPCGNDDHLLDSRSNSPFPGVKMSTGNNDSLMLPDQESNPDLFTTNHRLCLNLGKELFVYPYMGCRKPVDITKPIDKRVYKGTNPTCHDFNAMTAAQETLFSLSLLIGFSGGQIQLVDPATKEVNKLYNEERVIDKTRVTCIRWVPNSTTMFLVSHASGHMYLYNVDNSCGNTAPHYQVSKQGPGYSVWNCKSKTPRNPITRWTLGEGAINEFVFSPCGQFVSVVSQDGFLRIFRYDSHELVGVTRSYFGGLLCVCWSPDGKYICVGGEDDLVTLWSFKERRVVARGQGHKSWVSVVAFDPFTTTYGDMDSSEDCGGGDSGVNRHHLNDCQSSGVFSCDSVATSGIGSTSTTLHHPSCVSCSCQQNNSTSGKQLVNHVNNTGSTTNCNVSNFVSRSSRYSRTSESMRLSVSEPSSTRIPACYRVGSVGQDTQLCLWDLTEDVLKQPFGKSRPASRAPGDMSPCTTTVHSNSKISNSHHHHHTSTSSSPNLPNPTSANLSNCTSSTVSSSSAPSNSVTHSHEKDDSSSNAVLAVPNNVSGAVGVPTAVVSGSVTNVTSSVPTGNNSSTNGNGTNSQHSTSGHSHSILSLRFGALSFGSGDKDKEKSKDKDTKEHKRNFSLGSSKPDKNAAGSSKSTGVAALSLGINVNLEDPLKLIGTQACPRLDECPLLEPLVCKKISHERLTSLVFREESIVTACQDGIVCTWARPGDVISQL